LGIIGAPIKINISIKMSEKLKLEFLRDEPVANGGDGYFSFYHEYVSPTLEKIVNKNTIYTVGLFGRWGTGKSSIIEMLSKTSKKPVYVFDAWKYQNDPLRRTFLLGFFRFVQQQKLWKKDKQLEESYLDDLYMSTSESAEVTLIEKSGKTSQWRDWLKGLWLIIKNNLFLFGLFLFGASWLLLQIKLGEKFPIVEAGLRMVGYISQSTSVAVILGWSIKIIVEKLVENLLQDMTKSAKISTLIKSRDFLNSPEQFENKFRDIVKRLNKKVVIVFDNMDRVQGSSAVEALASVKTFFEPKEEANVVFIVPCDYEAISRQIRQYHQEDPAEFLRKLFSVVVWTPEFIFADLEDYTRALIKNTGEDSSLLVNDDLIYVIKQAYGQNPREIKQFINNFIAELYLASNTDVWEIVKGKVGYLAKVLVLRQKFPHAYEELKVKWSTPEEIIEKGDSNYEELRSFMENTRLITTKDASPFLYFKKPLHIQNVIHAEDIVQKLLADDYAGVEGLIKENEDFEAVVRMMLGLFGQYSQLLPQLHKLVLGSIRVFASTAKISSSANFYNEAAKIIDKDLWKDYLGFPTVEVFDYLVASDKIEPALRRSLITRYISVLGSEELKDIANREVLNQILNSLIKWKKYHGNEEKKQIARHIQARFADRPEVIGLFETEADIKAYISDQTVQNFIQALKLENFITALPILPRFKERIVSSNLPDLIAQQITALVKEETVASADFRPEKDTLFRELLVLFGALGDFFNHVGGSPAEALATELVNAAKHISNPDEKSLAISCLQYVYPVVVQNSPVILNTRQQFLIHASAQTVKEFLDRESKLDRANVIIQEDILQLHPVLETKPEYREVIYRFASDESKAAIIQNLVIKTPNKGLDLLANLTEIPQRTHFVSLMLDELLKLQLPDRIGGYGWVVAQIRDNDPVELKDKLEQHILEAVKLNDNNLASVGYDLFTKAMVLSQPKRREIAQQVLVCLRQPGEKPNSNNRYAFKTVVHAIMNDGLQDTLRRELIFTLLSLVRPTENRQTHEVVLESIKELKPSFAQFQQDYLDLLEAMRNWPDDENRRYVAGELLTIKPTRRMRLQQSDFWNELASMQTQAQ